MKRIAPLFFLFFLCIQAVTAQESGGPYVSDANTVLLMHFEDDLSNAAGVGNDGVSHGTGVSYETTDGGFGKALRLDNTTSDKQSWIEVPFYDDLNFSEEFSVECWFKLNSWGESPTGARALFKKEWQNGLPEYELLLFASGSYSANLDCIDDEEGEWDANARSSEFLELHTWYHLAMYYNHAHKHIYCLIRDENYEEVYASRSYSETPPVNGDGELMIGYGAWSESFFDGWIDELRISNNYRKYRDDVLAGVDVEAFPDSVFVPLKDKWTVYQWPLAEYYPVYNATGEINRSNACGPTMLTRTIHYWEHPRFPSGLIQHNKDDCNWYADFDNTEYLWDQMPEGFPPGTTEEDYAPSATLSAQVGTASQGIYNYMYSMPGFLKENFHYSKNTRVLFEEEYSKEEWENIFKNELSHGRPIMIGGVEERTAYGGSGHYYICNGYNSKDEFFTDYSFNDNFWADLDDFYYGIAQDIIIFLEPDWNDKSLELLAPASNANIPKGTDLEIRWTSAGVNNVKLEYSVDAGYNWLLISESVDASTGSYIWSLPSVESESYKVRVSDAEDLNVNRRSGAFTVYDQKQMAFEYPKAGTILKGGASQVVYWTSIGINAFTLEYSTDNEVWNTLRDSVVAMNGNAICDLPDIAGTDVVLRARDLDDESLSFKSEAFILKSDLLWGGPYVSEDETLLLMHFEENLQNSANTSLLPVEGAPSGYFIENYDRNMGKAFRIDNSDGTPVSHYVWIDNSKDIDPGTSWTIEAWVKVVSTMGEKTVGGIIMDKWDAFGINAGYQHFCGFVNFENGSNIEFWSTQEYTLNQWYHVAMISDADAEEVNFLVHDDTYELVYEDSQAFPEGSNGLIKSNENLLKVGGLGGGSNLEFDGFMDEVRIIKKVVDYSSMSTGFPAERIRGTQLNLKCYPNPVTAESVLSFTTGLAGKLSITIYDMNGRKIRTVMEKELPQGSHSIPLGADLNHSGIYICRLESSQGVSSIKLVTTNH